MWKQVLRNFVKLSVFIVNIPSIAKKLTNGTSNVEADECQLQLYQVLHIKLTVGHRL